jgi:hypothetical protein
MTTLDYLEKIDDTLSHWEDYFHGQEGTDVTEARSNLDKVRKQLLIHSVVVPKGTLSYDPKCDNACKFYCTKGNTQYPECLK